MLTWEKIEAYRARTYRTEKSLRVRTKEEAIAHANARGFITFWPIKAVEIPSLWVSVAGDRPVPNNHDDPAHVTWGWKDDLLGERVWYYGKVLRRKATIISLDIAPYFYALSENFGSPELDYLDQYQQGTLSQEAKVIYEALLREGPLHSPALRRASSLTSKSSRYPFSRGLDELQADFKVLPIGVARAGAWNYAFVYDCVHRHYPDLPERAHQIRIPEARQKLLTLYFESVGATDRKMIAKVFYVLKWTKRELERTIAALVEEGAVREVELEGLEGPQLVSTDALM
jgi:hypothetical protein